MEILIKEKLSKIEAARKALRKELHKAKSIAEKEGGEVVVSFRVKANFKEHTLNSVFRTYIHSDFPEYTGNEWNEITKWRQELREAMLKKLKKEFSGFKNFQFTFGNNGYANGIIFSTSERRFYEAYKDDIKSLRKYWPVEINYRGSVYDEEFQAEIS